MAFHWLSTQILLSRDGSFNELAIESPETRFCWLNIHITLSPSSFSYACFVFIFFYMKNQPHTSVFTQLSNSFPDFYTSMFNLLVLLTTANHPDGESCRCFLVSLFMLVTVVTAVDPNLQRLWKSYYGIYRLRLCGKSGFIRRNSIIIIIIIV